MAWLATLMAALAGYFLLILFTLRIRLRSFQPGRVRILVLLVYNIGYSAEAILWDLIRLESWRNGDFSFAFVDQGSTDDTVSILKIFQKRYGFDLYQGAPGQGVQIRQHLAGENIRLVKVSGPESSRVTRRRIIAALNDSNGSRTEEMSGC